MISFPLVGDHSTRVRKKRTVDGPILSKKSVVTVVIPIHKEEPSELEKISLSQTLAVLHSYPITFMTPTGLNTQWYEEFCRDKAQIFFERFEWKGWQAFAEMMISPVFYQRFLAYEYMLICHLDAFVFRDELEEWCALNHDYIGAVIYNNGYSKPKTFWRNLIGFNFPTYVGAGGFCLKKTSTFYRITSRYKKYIDLFLWTNKKLNRIFLDDVFVSLHFPKLEPNFSIPPKSLAEHFGADFNTNWEAENLPFNNQDNSTMPFGVHAWIQYHQDYWKPCIQRYGYSL
ncbi:DUF5672 family protein [Hymenobacter sp.]|jgi:hypothetical protein|uniref:DUF5672 family protein n=1 Tax=Hymenobacter sp. TaxID=1898978 RepID=UPI002EDABA08